MQGRIYDPTVARFLSADPFAASPLTSQGFNRYSYVSNSPLGFVDPTGFTGRDNRSPCDAAEGGGGNAGSFNSPPCATGGGGGAGGDGTPALQDAGAYAEPGTGPGESFTPGTQDNVTTPQTDSNGTVTVTVADNGNTSAQYGNTAQVPGASSPTARGFSGPGTPYNPWANEHGLGAAIAGSNNWFTSILQSDQTLKAAQDFVLMATIQAEITLATGALGELATAGEVAEEGVAAEEGLGATACFVAGTPVETCDRGEQPIEELEPGEEVLSRDPDSEVISCQPIVRTFRRQADDLGRVTYTDAGGKQETILATLGHRFWVEGRGWVALGDVAANDVLQAASGETLHVSALQGLRSRPTTVYNIEVKSSHTYFVGKSHVWVHNACGPNITDKIAGQLEGRGWTAEQIQEAIESGDQVDAINKATGNPAIRYIHPETGQSVVVDTVTNDVIHVGGPGFQYGPASGDVP